MAHRLRRQRSHRERGSNWRAHLRGEARADRRPLLRGREPDPGRHPGRLGDRRGRGGALLALTFNVSRIASNACAPLAGAVVDVWHCNALGVYSGVQDPGFDTLGQDWLRGNLFTDASGMATFTTIFPGWYQGRATHIHFKVRSPAGTDAAYEFTSQLFFPESFLTALYTGQEPYTSKGDAGRLGNSADGIYNQGGSELLLTPTTTAEGYAAAVNIGLDLD